MRYYKSLMGFLCFSLIFGYLTKENCYVEKRNIVKNARQTAKTYGYNVENLTYISDKELAGKSAWGSKYRYNTLNQWNGLYTSYDESYDALYVFVLSRTKVNTNANSIDNGYFRIVAKFLDIKYFVSYLSRNNDKNITASTSDIIYSPETYGNVSISETQSLSIGVTASGEVSNDGGQLGASISFGASNSNTVNKSCVLLKPNSMPLNESGNELGKNDGYNIYGRKVELRFDWQNTYKKNLNGKSPYRGDFIINTMIMFSIPCYSSSIGNSLKIKIDTTANSQKFSTACINNCTGYDVRESKQTTVFEHKIG